MLQVVLDILQIAQENFVVSIAVVLSIGIIQGAVLGRGIRRRFPSLKTHARVVSIVLLVLFGINAVFSIIKFANPTKFSWSDVTIPENPEQGIDVIIKVLGLDTGFVTVFALFISMTLILAFRQARLPKIARYFIFLLSAAMFALSLVGRFTDYIPAFFELVMYSSYQIGIAVGLFAVTSRRGQSAISEFEGER